VPTDRSQLLPRLACVRPAASVRSEPGSNSQVDLERPDQSCPQTKRPKRSVTCLNPYLQSYLLCRLPKGYKNRQQSHDSQLNNRQNQAQSPREPNPQNPNQTKNRRPRIPSSFFQQCQRARSLPLDNRTAQEGQRRSSRFVSTGPERLSRPDRPTHRFV
jgi:hypothetical protein